MVDKESVWKELFRESALAFESAMHCLKISVSFNALSGGAQYVLFEVASVIHSE